MNKASLNPSTISNNQIRKLSVQFEDALRKAEPLSLEAQDLIENGWDELKDETLAAFERAVQTVLDRKRNTLTFKVKVRRGLTGQQVIDGTGRKQYKTQSVVDNMPLLSGEGEEEVEFVFFKLGRSVPDSEVEAELKKYGLVQDIAAQAQCNADHPEFADDHPNGASWKDENGIWCYAYFDRSFDDERYVYVNKSYDDWNGSIWLGGRKVQQPSVA